MNVLRKFSMLAFAVAVALAGCERERGRDVTPTPETTARALGARWHQRATPETLQDAVREYQSLSPALMEDFLNAEADAMYQELGQDRLVTEEYRKTRLFLNRLSVEKYGAGFNKISGLQFDALLESAEAVPRVEALSALQSMVEGRIVKKKNPGGRTQANVCYYDYSAPFSGFTCPQPYITLTIRPTVPLAGKMRL